MQTITDWLMVGITGIYVIATIFICVFNGKSAKATREQVAESKRQIEESKRQFVESKRLETMPFLQMEICTEREHPQFEIEFDLCNGKSNDVIYKIVKLKNLGNGSASNIIYEWKQKSISKPCIGYPPINAIMHGDSYYIQLTFIGDDTIEEDTSGVLKWQFYDLLGNSYEQKVVLIFSEGDLVRCENDVPQYLGEIRYEKSVGGKDDL